MLRLLSPHLTGGVPCGGRGRTFESCRAPTLGNAADTLVVALDDACWINRASVCGFVHVGSQTNDVEELLFELRDGL